MYRDRERVSRVQQRPVSNFLPTLQICAVIWLTIWVPWRPDKGPLHLPLLRRPPIVAREALVPAPMPIGFHALGIAVRNSGALAHAWL